MQARMNNIAMLVPGALQALLELGQSSQTDKVPKLLRHLIHLRTSQINGCSFCVDLHARDARDAGELEERLYALAAWRDTPYFSEAERAALALTEASTRLSDRAESVTDEIWDEACQHFDEEGLASLIIEIALTNAWNRLNATTRQVAGSIRR